jgi:hypothetical protein
LGLIKVMIERVWCRLMGKKERLRGVMLLRRRRIIYCLQEMAWVRGGCEDFFLGSFWEGYFGWVY